MRFLAYAGFCTECTTGFALALVMDRGPWLLNRGLNQHLTGTNGTPATIHSYRAGFGCTTTFSLLVHQMAKAQ